MLPLAGALVLGSPIGFFAIGVPLLVIGGCRGGLKPVRFETAERQSPSRVHATGDWDDVEAAAIVASGKAEMALLMVDDSKPDRVVIDMTTVNDAPARAIASRVPGAPDLIDLECRVGHFGDPAQERRFLAAMIRRLRELHRRSTAPVRF